MRSGDPSISNGTCYWKAGKKSHESFIPCGNVADGHGHKHCCRADEECLEHNACFSPPTGATYLAGCTDFDYEAPACPDKGHWTEWQWVGLVYIPRRNVWSACPQSLKPSTITLPDPCPIPTTSPVAAFTETDRIINVGHMPFNQGGTMDWSPGFTPTYTDDSVPTVTPQSSVTIATTTAGSSSSADSTSSTSGSASTSSVQSASATPIGGVTSDSGMSAGVLAGIIIGSVVGGLLILGALSALLIIYRRNRINNNTTPPEPVIGPLSDPPFEPRPADMRTTPAEPLTPGVSELGSDTTARPWSMRSALHGIDSGLHTSMSSDLRPYAGQPLPVPEEYQNASKFQPYRPHGYTNIWELSG
ncbi:hypothetical protein B0H66DRAFT_639463 [Apodospora peruviana]|uniref:Uncharacterized protein n=1 Tax=Apodospora peruviana TaxID=516989 RepID=A0AAE0M446_9PEZI|nr:hypothetical protein B0H66DRAFT_639463 [Apodospora peruviana]